MQAYLITDEQILKIHHTSLAILDKVGVQVPHQEMLARFADAGARVDHPAQRVFIPSALVERALQSAGKTYTLYGRDLTRTAKFGQGARNYNSIAGEGLWVEEPGGERRPTSLLDVATAARFGDALEALTIVGAMADPQEVPVGVRCVEVLATLLANTTKPLTFWYYDRAAARWLNEIMIVLRGDVQRAERYPLCYPFFEPISPLRFPFHGIDLLFETARLNLPVPIGPMAQMGISAPGTVAATLAQQNAEILAGLCITQLVRPGMPVCYGGICHAFDMRTTQMIFSGPEQAIFGVAMTQMGKHYGLPVYINVGLTDAKRPDAQAGMEAGITLMLGAAAGADIFGHLGISGMDQAASLDMLAMQHEIIRYVESTLRAIDFSDEALGFDEISAVGPGGSYIDRDFTANFFRRELFFPTLLDREYYEAWRSSGAMSMEERIRERKRALLASHQPEPLPDDISREIDRIVAAARQETMAGQPAGVLR